MNTFDEPVGKTSPFLGHATGALSLRRCPEDVVATEKAGGWKLLALILLAGGLFGVAQLFHPSPTAEAWLLGVAGLIWLVAAIWLRPVHVRILVSGRHPRLAVQRRLLLVLPIGCRFYGLEGQQLAVGTFERRVRRVRRVVVDEGDGIPMAARLFVGLLIPFAGLFMLVAGSDERVAVEQETGEFMQRRLGLLLRDEASGRTEPLLAACDESSLKAFLSSVNENWPGLAALDREAPAT